MSSRQAAVPEMFLQLLGMVAQPDNGRPDAGPWLPMAWSLGLRTQGEVSRAGSCDSHRPDSQNLAANLLGQYASDTVRTGIVSNTV